MHILPIESFGIREITRDLSGFHRSLSATTPSIQQSSIQAFLRRIAHETDASNFHIGLFGVLAATLCIPWTQSQNNPIILYILELTDTDQPECEIAIGHRKDTEFIAHVGPYHLEGFSLARAFDLLERIETSAYEVEYSIGSGQGKRISHFFQTGKKEQIREPAIIDAFWIMANPDLKNPTHIDRLQRIYRKIVELRLSMNAKKGDTIPQMPHRARLSENGLSGVMRVTPDLAGFDRKSLAPYQRKRG